MAEPRNNVKIMEIYYLDPGKLGLSNIYYTHLCSAPFQTAILSVQDGTFCTGDQATSSYREFLGVNQKPATFPKYLAPDWVRPCPNNWTIKFTRDYAKVSM